MRLRLRTDRLAELLAASRLSQNHWAIKLGLSRGHWSDLVNGRHPYPSAKTRERMLEVFGVSLDELFVAEDDRADDLEFRRAISPRYEILQELGQGAMGSVFLATDRTLGRLVAVKVVSPEAAAGVGTAALLKEIAFIARLQHPNILPLFEAGEYAGHPYYVMPYVREGSLRALLERRGRVSASEVVGIVDGIARGLAYAHERQILHCDVKPENVLVQDGHCFVMDFGIARKLRSEALEWARVRNGLDLSAGTPAYVSPEQALGAGDVDQRSDVYSLACVAFEMLSGRAPFGGRNTEEIVSRRFNEPAPPLTALVPDIPPRVSEVIERAMSLDRALRPERARELASSLERALAPSPTVGAQTAGPAAPIPVSTHAARHAGPALTRSRDLSMHRFRSDLRVAVRSLRAHWRFALGVVLTLGLGIGLGVPVLGLADAYFLRPPAGVRDPGRVVRLVERGMSRNGPYFTDGMTGLDYSVIKDRARSFSSVAAWSDRGRSLGRGAGARTIDVTLATASLFTVAGVRPYLGRFYLDSEDGDDVAQPPCVVSYGFWKRELNGARDAIGKRLVIGALTYTVVGVAPPNFAGFEIGSTDAWLPLRASSIENTGHDPNLWTTDGSSWLRMAGRLAPGVNLRTADAEVAVLYRTSGERRRDPKLEGTLLLDPIEPGRTSLSNYTGHIALWLATGGLLLLVLVTANLVNLFVARAAARMRQTAIRIAMGGRWRDVFRLELVEALLLGAGAALFGLVIAGPATGIARARLMPGVDWARPTLDLRVALFAFVIATAVGALVAMWSAAQASRTDPADLLRGIASGHTVGTRRSRGVRRALLITQAAIFAILLTGAGAFVSSLRRMTHVDFGFDPKRVAAGRIPLPSETPRDREIALMTAARERVAALPDVESAALAYMEPWANNTIRPLFVPGSTANPPFVIFDIADPNYLRTLGVGMRNGRWFDASDNAGAPLVTVVNETMQRAYWPDGNAIGKCMRIGADTAPCRTVVGVVRDFHVTGRADDAPLPVYWVPLAQSSGFPQRPLLLFRPRGDMTSATRSVRRVLQTLQSGLPAVTVRPISANTVWFTAPLELGATAFTVFGVLALLVGAVGLYSVLSFLIIEERRIHAIKLAIGAAPTMLASDVARYALATTLAGLAIGLALLVPLAPVLEPLLFHTRVFEISSLAAVAVLAVVVAGIAAAAPMRSVLRTDVMSVLREQ